MPGWNESQWFSFLTGVALKSVAVLGVAWIVAFLMRGRSAAARHIVWMAAFGALLALPLLSVFVPAVPVPGTGVILAPQVVFQVDAAEWGRPPGLQADAPVGLRPKAGQGAARRPGGLPHMDWRAILMLAWAAGAAAALTQMLAGLAYMRHLRLRARTMARGDLPELAGSLGIRHRVDAFETAPGRMPMSFGLLRPAVFMPADSAEWSEERRRVVLLHELAHVRRGDHAKHLLARAALCLYWWNPLAWAAWRAFLKERERAADDLVLTAGARASDYAAHLLEIARAMRSAPVLGAAAVAVARRSQLESRLLAILDSGRNRKSPGRAGALAAALICAAVVIPLAALQAQDSSQALPADIDGAVRAALAQRNHETLVNLAKAAEAQRRYDLAKQLLESALAIRGQNSGPNSLEYGKELVRLADVEHKRGEPQAIEHYKQAVAILGSDPAAGPALIGLGIASMSAKLWDEAFGYFQRAQTVAPAKASEAVMWQAIVRERQIRDQEADQLYKLALLLAAPNTAEPATVMELYARLLDRQGRLTEAAEMRDKAAAIRKSIPPTTAQFTRPAGQTQAGSGGLNAIVSSAMSLPAPPPPPVTSQGIGSSPSRAELRVGGYVPPSGTATTPPKLMLKVEPEYSEAARAAKFQGTVVLKVDVMPDGTAQNISVQRSSGLGLDEKAIEAVHKWRFQPGTRDGRPVTVTSTIEVNFRLAGDSAVNQAAAPAGQTVPDNGVYRVGGGVTAPRLLQKIEPEYTEEARFAHYDGTVILYVEIGTDGLAQNIKVTRGLGLGLDEKAVEAVSKWRFSPGTRFGAPVTVAATIEVNFRLL